MYVYGSHLEAVRYNRRYPIYPELGMRTTMGYMGWSKSQEDFFGESQTIASRWNEGMESHTRMIKSRSRVISEVRPPQEGWLGTGGDQN
jgi:hypothetical protein